MAAIFDTYAKYYDLLYHDKDYPGETRFVDRLVQRFLHTREIEVAPVRLLDLGCGTGRHAVEFAQLGYDVTASDPSSVMLAQACDRAHRAGVRVATLPFSFESADQIGGQFDVVVSMFAAINYLPDLAALRLAVKNIYQLLAPNGLFIFDHWNGAAVAEGFSPIRELKKTIGEREIWRISKTTLDLDAQVARVNFRCRYSERGEMLAEFEENHLLRLLFAEELSDLLSKSGFLTELQTPFMDSERPVTSSDWNISVVARKIA